MAARIAMSEAHARAGRCCSSRSSRSRWRRRQDSTLAHPAPDLGPPRPAPGLRRPRRAGPAGTRSRPLMPEAEVADMIVEIRSVTQGVGTYRTEFDHLQELSRPHRRSASSRRPRSAAARLDLSQVGGGRRRGFRLCIVAHIGLVELLPRGVHPDAQQTVFDGGRPGDGHRTVTDPHRARPSLGRPMLVFVGHEL